MIPSRTHWYLEELAKDSDNIQDREPKEVPSADAANLIASKLSDGRHAPALDIDLPCELVASSTPGHFHLYIDKPMSWEEYRLLLHTLAYVGIIEDGYYNASVKQGATFLRPPGQLKEAA